MPATRPQMGAHLPCPRCDSTNTKFCYYNNYNLSQPRHFCKACRRYWTQGGTLRNIPVGGATRKTSKRPRPSSAVNTNIAPCAKSEMIISSEVNLNDSVSGSQQGYGGLEEMGQYGIWTFPEASGVENGLVDGECCFAWPELAISMPGQGSLKSNTTTKMQ